MFPRFLRTGQTVWLGLLYSAWAALVFLGHGLGHAPDGAPRIPTWARMDSSLLLVVVAWTWVAWVEPGPIRLFARRVAWGMSWGLVGDLCLAGICLPRSAQLPAGILTFAIGHVCYIRGMLGLAGALALDRPLRGWIAWAIGLAVASTGWYLVVLQSGFSSPFLVGAALGYTWLLGSTAGVACGLAWKSPRFFPLAAGGLLFFASDFTFAMSVFNPPLFEKIAPVWRPDIGWLTYGPAQALIVLSVAIAWAQSRAKSLSAG
jgi:hypothetical protein